MTEHVEVFIKYKPFTDPTLKAAVRAEWEAIEGTTWLDHDSPSVQFVEYPEFTIAALMREYASVTDFEIVQEIRFRKVNHG